MLEKALNILFPPKCIFCGKINKDSICKKCEIKINYLKKDKIKKMPNENFTYHIYAYDYKNEIREKMLDLKFQDKPETSEAFAKLLLKNEKICRFLKSYDIIIPVPMYIKKQKMRGYNQSSLIANKIAKHLNMQYAENVLIKTKQTEMQSRLDASQRQNNVKNAYECKNMQKIRNKKVILFDDIYTTGSTARECTKALKEADTKEIAVLTFAKD